MCRWRHRCDGQQRTRATWATSSENDRRGKASAPDRYSSIDMVDYSTKSYLQLKFMHQLLVGRSKTSWNFLSVLFVFIGMCEICTNFGGEMIWGSVHLAAGGVLSSCRAACKRGGDKPPMTQTWANSVTLRINKSSYKCHAQSQTTESLVLSNSRSEKQNWRPNIVAPIASRSPNPKRYRVAHPK